MTKEINTKPPVHHGYRMPSLPLYYFLFVLFRMVFGDREGSFFYVVNSSRPSPEYIPNKGNRKEKKGKKRRFQEI